LFDYYTAFESSARATITENLIMDGCTGSKCCLTTTQSRLKKWRGLAIDGQP
jgi:hypothetical protein